MIASEKREGNQLPAGKVQHRDGNSGIAVQRRLPSVEPDALVTNGTKPLVLVVEDEWLIQLDIALEVEQAGFAVECASTVEQALDLLNSRNFHAALLDGWLGSCWSEPVSKELERLGIPYVLCSGHPKAALLWARPHTLVQKPINPERLVNELRRLTGFP